MNGFYEHYQDNNPNLHVTAVKFFLFPAHFHQKIEVFILKQGAVSVTCNGNTFNLNDGDIAFFNSYDVHSYCNQTNAVTAFCIIIPSEFAMRFFERNKNKSIKCPIIRNPKLCDELYSLTERFLFQNTDNNIKRNCTELILSLLEQELQFTDDVSTNETTTLVKKVLMYINNNFKGDVSLTTICKQLGYSDAHISRAFGKYVKRSIPDYVNELRLKEVERLIRETDLKVTDIIFKAGFNSLQTYYRYKSKKTKTS